MTTREAEEVVVAVSQQRPRLHVAPLLGLLLTLLAWLLAAGVLHHMRLTEDGQTALFLRDHLVPHIGAWAVWSLAWGWMACAVALRVGHAPSVSFRAWMDHLRMGALALLTVEALAGYVVPGLYAALNLPWHDHVAVAVTVAVLLAAAALHGRALRLFIPGARGAWVMGWLLAATVTVLATAAWIWGDLNAPQTQQLFTPNLHAWGDLRSAHQSVDGALERLWPD